MGKSYVVVGAGFRGFCDALELLKDPSNKVHIIESAPFFGGVMSSLEVDGFKVDKGVHVFDSIPKGLAEIVAEIMQGDVRNIDFASASVFNDRVTEGFSLPDLSSLSAETRARITLDLVELAANPPKESAKNLGEVFNHRYGKTAGDIYRKIFQKVYSTEADKAEPTAIAQTSLGRLKFLDDPEMLALTAHPWMDTVLAARRKSVGKVDDYVSIYPNDGQAMKGWCERAMRWLQNKGVIISLGEKILSIRDTANAVQVKTDKQVIEADYVIWANDNVGALGAALQHQVQVDHLVSGTPMVFVTLITKAEQIKDFTYLQNFDPPAKAYRTAAAGIFSNQIRKDGMSFLTCECPTTIGSVDWEDPAKVIKAVWQECLDYGVVAPQAQLEKSFAHRLPISFKIALSGYRDKIAQFDQEIPRYSRRTLLRDVVPFFRRDIYLDSLKLQSVLETAWK